MREFRITILWFDQRNDFFFTDFADDDDDDIELVYQSNRPSTTEPCTHTDTHACTHRHLNRGKVFTVEPDQFFFLIWRRDRNGHHSSTSILVHYMGLDPISTMWMMERVEFFFRFTIFNSPKNSIFPFRKCHSMELHWHINRIIVHRTWNVFNLPFVPSCVRRTSMRKPTISACREVNGVGAHNVVDTSDRDWKGGASEVREEVVARSMCDEAHSNELCIIMRTIYI